MQKSKLASLIDATIIAGSALLLTIMITTKITTSLVPRLGISCIIAVFVFQACIKKDKRKFQNQQLKISEEKHLKNCILYLNSIKNTDRTQFLSQIFEKYKIDNNFSLVSFFYDLASEMTTSETLSQVLSLVQDNSDDVCILITNGLSKSASELLSYAKSNLKTNIILMKSPDLYTLMKQQNNFPVPMDLSTTTFSIKKFFSHFSGALSRQRAKHYFFLAIIFLFSSYVLPFKSHYITFACIALTLTIITLLFGKHEKQHQR